MRNPAGWRRIALLSVPAGALIAAIPVWPVARALPDVALAVGFAIGGTVLLFALILLHHSHRAARAQSRLARGIGELARWRVDAAAWQAFVDRESTGAGADPGLPNELLPTPRAPAAGVEIVIGEDAIAIGDSIHLLPLHGAPEVLDATLAEACPGFHLAELRLRHPATVNARGNVRPARNTRLTFPVAPDAWRTARRALGRYALGRPGKATFVHGAGDGSNPEDLNTCDRCGYRTHRYLATCPGCGAGMLTRRWARRYGAVLILLGGAIAVAMTVVLVKLSPMLANPGVEVGGTRFSGTGAQALAVWAVLGAVWAFGATATAQGLHQLLTGRRKTARVLALCAAMGTVVVLATGLVMRAPAG